MASGRLMSLVGAGRNSNRLPMPRTSNRLQVKMKTNRVRASGTTLAPRGPMDSSTCLWTAPTTSSQRSWNLLGTPLVALDRRIIPNATTTRPAMMVAHTMSTLTVRPNTLAWGCSPTEMSEANSGALSRWVPRPITSLTPPGLVGWAERRVWVVPDDVVLDHIGVDHVVHRGHRSRLGHGPGHVGQEDHLEDGQPAQDAEPQAGRHEQQPDGHDRDDPHPAQGVEGQGPTLVLLLAGAHPCHRVADHPEIESAEGQADTGADTQERVPEGDAGEDR